MSDTAQRGNFANRVLVDLRQEEAGRTDIYKVRFRTKLDLAAARQSKVTRDLATHVMVMKV